jgi:hypothetical protein
MDPILIPILVPLGAFAMIFGLRYFENKERMSMIEKGMDPGLRRKKPLNPITSLKWGLILLGVGAGLMTAFWLTTYVLQTEADQSTPIYFGMIGIFGGLGLITSYLFEKKTQKIAE